MESNKLLSSRNASNYLSPSAKTDLLKVARSTGKLWGNKPPKFVKINTRVFYKKESIDQWLEDLTTDEYSTNAESLTMNELTELI